MRDAISDRNGSINPTVLGVLRASTKTIGIRWFASTGTTPKNITAWLSNKVGKAYRLLTEAEREYAARAKTTTRYSFGDDDAAVSEYAWYKPNSGSATHPVGQKKPNAFGLFDMHGNVWAWCEDSWHPNYRGAPNDGSAWRTGGTPSRVLRGGSWFRPADGLRSAYRVKFSPEARYNDVGFRVARGL